MMRGDDAPDRQQLTELLYTELRQIARAHLRAERPGHTLQPTALVNEAYVRMMDGNETRFTSRAHFLALMSVVMRRILVDYARKRNAARRGGDRRRVTINLGMGSAPPLIAVELLDLDAALDSLALQRQTSARFVEMHYFAGMTAEEIAEATVTSVHTVRQKLRFAQAWLRRRMGAPAP